MSFLSALLWESVGEIQKICGPQTALMELFLPLLDVLCGEAHTPSSVTVPKNGPRCHLGTWPQDSSSDYHLYRVANARIFSVEPKSLFWTKEPPSVPEQVFLSGAVYNKWSCSSLRQLFAV